MPNGPIWKKKIVLDEQKAKSEENKIIFTEKSNQNYVTYKKQSNQEPRMKRQSMQRMPLKIVYSRRKIETERLEKTDKRAKQNEARWGKIEDQTRL